jgi:hypothetical protein
MKYFIKKICGSYVFQGTNNLHSNTPEDIAHEIKEIINQLLLKMASTKILLLGIISRVGNAETKLQAINTTISKYNDDKHVFYLDMSDKFQDSPGKEKAIRFGTKLWNLYSKSYTQMNKLVQKFIKIAFIYNKSTAMLTKIFVLLIDLHYYIMKIDETVCDIFLLFHFIESFEI